MERAILSSSEAFVVVETTWKTSGLDGELGRIVKAATEEPENTKNRNSWRVLFFGWQGNPLYQQEHGMIDDAAEKYFASVEPLLDKPLTRHQKYWYAQKLRESSPRHMKSEYPTIASECWTVVPEGSFFGAYIEKAKA